jgi:hypothetical protein
VRSHYFTGLKLRIKAIFYELDLDYQSLRIKKYMASSPFRVPSDNQEKIVYVEWPQMASNNLALVYFLNAFCKSRKATAVALRMAKGGRISRLKQLVKFHFSVLKFMGISELEYLNYTDISPKTRLDLKAQFSSLATKNQLLNFKYKEVLVGDLVYDTYLTRFRAPTVNLTDARLLEVFCEILFYVDKLDVEFSSQKVEGVFVSHSVYHYAVPARVAHKYGIDAFIVQMEEVSKLTGESQLPFLPSDYYKRISSSLSKDEIEEGIRLAKAHLQERFDGKYSSELELSSGKSFLRGPSSIDGLPRRSKKLRILIATHDFFDAPHYYGNFFYPDFYEWLMRLKEIGEITDYEWLIKVHPDARGKMEELIREIFADSERFNVLPVDTSHHTLIASGVDVALTVHGTIGMEYPILGVPVVNASAVNPHSAFDFCITPKDLNEYENILMTLDSKKPIIGRDSPYLFFYLKFICAKRNWMYENHNVYLEEVGGYSGSYSKKAYSNFLNSSTRLSEDALGERIHRFMNDLATREVEANTAAELKPFI